MRRALPLLFATGLAIALLAASSSQALSPRLEAALDDGRFEATPGGFRIIALSHIADGCAAGGDEAARSCVERAFQRALQDKPAKLSIDGASHGLWLSHLALLLGAGDATGPCLDEKLHGRVARALARASTADPTGHAASYPKRPERWPADQAATLAALKRYDVAHAGALVVEPLARYRKHIEEKATHNKTMLPFSEARGRGSAGRLPRGCALSFSVRYLAEVDFELAEAWWRRYRELYLVDAGVLVGFREWPPGVERKADVDSGPIVKGVGASATAFGIAAARAVGDKRLATRLEVTAAMVGAAAKGKKEMARHATSTLAEAILFQAAGQPSLWEAR